jgi:hypothetical protein
MEVEILMKLHISGFKFTPVSMRDERKAIYQALQLQNMGLGQYDISTFLNVNQIQVRRWLEEEL